MHFWNLKGKWLLKVVQCRSWQALKCFTGSASHNLRFPTVSWKLAVGKLFIVNVDASGWMLLLMRFVLWLLGLLPLLFLGVKMWIIEVCSRSRFSPHVGMFPSSYLGFFPFISEASRSSTLEIAQQWHSGGALQQKLSWRSFFYQFLTVVCDCLSLYETRWYFYIVFLNGELGEEQN